MANNTLIGTTNQLATATLKNGTGGGAPALDETSPYVMTNVKNSDRSTVWQTGNPPGASPLAIDFDFGGNRTISAAAVLGLRTRSSADVTSCTVFSASSAAGYPGGGAGWNNQGTITISAALDPRDTGILISSVSHRYWRFQFAHIGNAWAIGRLWLGDPTDLGLYHSSGALFSKYRNRLETPQPNGALVLNDLGDPGMDITLPFDFAGTSLKATLAALQAQAGSFILIDPDTNFYEVILKQGRVPVVRQFNSRYSVTLDLARLP